MENRLFTQNKIQDLLKDIRVLVSDLGWDYERMSRSGKDTYDEICEKLNID